MTENSSYELVQKLIKDLNAPAIKFWIDKKGALEKLAEMGPKAEPALEHVIGCLVGCASPFGEGSIYKYRLLAVKVFASVGLAAMEQVPVLTKHLDNQREFGNWTDAAAIALAIWAINPPADEVPDTVAALKRATDSQKASFLGRNNELGMKSCAAIALHRMDIIARKEAEQAIWKYVNEWKSLSPKCWPSAWPPLDFVEQLLMGEIEL